VRKICGENNKKDRKRLFCIFQIGIWEASFEVFVSIILLVGFFGRSFMIRLGIVTNGTLGLIYASHARRRPAKSLENNGAVQDFLSDVIQQLHTKNLHASV
jgi:uncharacterized protein YktB (UPF0637 family)